MANETLAAFSYDPANGELRNVWQYFDAAPRTAIGWLPAVAEGTAVQEGQVLGAVQYQDGSREDVLAPPGCAGTVARINGSFQWGDADKSPSQVLVLIQ